MPVPHPRRHVVAAVATATAVGLVLATVTAVAPPAQAVDTTSPVLVNEVYGGGGNAGAALKRDFVELVNRGTASVDLTGWSVWYSSAGGSSFTDSASYRTPLTGSIGAGGTYLVAEAAGTGGTTDLPTPDVTGSIALSATAGKIALTRTAAVPTGSTDGTVVDFVGYGTANDAAGGTPTGALSATTSAQRTDSPKVVNTGVNGADFTVATPTPDALNTAPTPPPSTCGTTPVPPECVPGSTTIQDVQGPGFLSPLVGQSVSKVPGIVTAKKSNGFWMQMAAPDTSVGNESSGVFVFGSTSAGAVTVGDSVLVTATVQEYYSTPDDGLAVTELTSPTVTVVSSGNPLPATLVITPTTVPATAMATPPAGSTDVEDIAAVDPTRSAQEFWEAHEGMLVSITDARVIGPGKSQYGEIYVTSKPDEARNSSGGATISGYDGTPAGRVLVLPTSGTVPPANVGDVLSGVTAGPVDWSSFGGYDIAATTVGTRQDNHLVPNDAPAQAADQLSVATYNVENLAPGDPADKYARLAQGIVTNLADPDVISVEEIQDNSGAADDGTVAADQTIGKLVTAIGAAGGPTYSVATIDPVNDQDGGQPGGNIRIVFLYNADRVGFTPKAPAGDPSTTAVTVSTGTDGTPVLSANPGRVDPTSPAWNASRKPLAGEFTFQGRKVIIVGNHLNSKGGDQNSDGRFQPPTRSSETQRASQAAELNTFVDQVKAADPDANVVLAGDFNDYQFSNALTTLTDHGALLTDLITTLPAVERYTYNYNGVSQVLDHILVSTNLTASTEYTVVHSNAEFADQASDHDPQVARIRLAAPAATTKTITMLGINDFHGRIDSNTVKFAGTIEQQRAAAGPDNTVLLSAGDNIGASLFASSFQHDTPTIDVLNALDLQASAVGNHEFDQGFADLTGRVADRANWDYLGANVYLKGTQTPALPEYKIVTVDGIRLGVIGAVTQETPSLVSPGGVANLDFGNPVEAVNRVAAQLTDGDESNGEADVLVAEYHAGAADSESATVDLPTELAKGGEFADIVEHTSAEVAAIWTGHTHRTYTFDAPVPGDPGRTRPVVQTGEYGANIGNITLTIDTADDAVTDYTATLVPRTTTADDALVSAYPRVAAVKKIVDKALARAAVAGRVPVGSVTQDITRAVTSTGGENRGAESTLGNLVADALQDELSSTDRGGAQIGVVNPGGLRADLTYADSGSVGDADGRITYAEANAVLPFGNRLFTVSLTGAQFKAVLEQQFQPSTSDRPFLNLGLSSNVSYTYDPTAAAGSRITSVTVNGLPLGPTTSYRIGTFSFLSDGGDNFTAFRGATNVQDTTLVDRDAWVDYLSNHPDLTPSFAKRVVVVTGQPSAVGGGSAVTFGVSNLDLTSVGSPATTTVTATIDGVVLGRFPVTAGAATVAVTIPVTVSGAKTLVLSGFPTGTVARIPLTVTKPGTVTTPFKAYAAGDKVTATLAGWAGRDRVVVTLNGVSQGAVTTSASGAGTLKFALPVTTPAGSYALTARSTTSRATATPVTLKISAKPFQAGTLAAGRTIVAKPGTVKLTLTNWVPGTPAAVTLDGTTPLGTVTTDAAGHGTITVTIAKSVPTGTHRLVATAPDGSTVSVNISVTAG